MHPLPRWLRKGCEADAVLELGSTIAVGIVHRDARCLNLWFWAGGAKPDLNDDEAFL